MLHRAIFLAYAKIFALTFFAQLALAAGPSFDCAKATTSTELMICSDSQLALLDQKLSQEYTAFKGSLHADDQVSLLRWQKEWLRQRNLRCGINDKSEIDAHDLSKLFCVTQMYYDRLAHINEIQLPYSGATAAFKIIGDNQRTPVEYISLLYNDILFGDNQIFHEIRCDHEKFTLCPRIHGAYDGNTVLFEFEKGGVDFSVARYRTFLTIEDPGSEEHTEPLAALEFEYRYRSDGSAAYITVSLTGYGKLDNGRLPHIPGLANPSGCMSC